MKFVFITILSMIAISAFAEEKNNVLTVNCKGVLEKVTAYNKVELKADHTIKLEISKNDDSKDQGSINRNGRIQFPEGYEVVYNINVRLGKGSIFGSGVDTTSEIRARLQRHTGGNGKIVLGASSLTINQKAEKKKSNVGIGIVNVRALDTMVNSTGITSLQNDPILFQRDFKEAVYTGTLDEGVVKGAQIECSTL